MKNFNKLFLLALMSFSCAYSMNMQRLPDRAVHAPSRLGLIAVMHNKHHFAVEDVHGVHEVNPVNMDSELRRLKTDRLALLSSQGYVQVNRTDDGQYTLRMQNRLPGGGEKGAQYGAIIGKCATYGLAYAGNWCVYFAVKAYTGDAEAATIARDATTAATKPFVEPLSNTMGVLCGLIGAIITGPV
jgi:hypothetical protein